MSIKKDVSNRLDAEVSQQQREILRHALGWPKNYRNHFCTGEGSDDFADCEALVEAGMMTRHKKSWVPDIIYMVTKQGRNVAG
jgi:hypothetical protein